MAGAGAGAGKTEHRPEDYCCQGAGFVWDQSHSVSCLIEGWGCLCCVPSRQLTLTRDPMIHPEPGQATYA